MLARGSSGRGPLLVNRAVPGQATRLPVGVQDRPERLVEALAISLERLSEDPFLDGADLPQRTVSPAVSERRARLEPADADGVERKAEHQPGAFVEHAGAPVWRPDGESPFGRGKVGR